MIMLTFINFRLTRRILYKNSKYFCRNKHTTLLDSYKGLVSSGRLKYDENQYRVVKLANKLSIIINQELIIRLDNGKNDDNNNVYNTNNNNNNNDNDNSNNNNNNNNNNR